MKVGVSIVFTLLFLTAPVVTEAAITNIYTNDNYWTSVHDSPVSFTQDSLGNFSGITVTGKLFTQTRIVNSYRIKIHKFAIDEAFFYITDKGVITADSDLVALSIYLSQPLS